MITRHETSRLKSPLPLVPYYPGEFITSSRELPRSVSDSIPAHDSIPHAVLSSVFHENYRRRSLEARKTGEASGLYDVKRVTADHDDLGRYISFRQIDTDPAATIGERTDLFLNHPYAKAMGAYEIHARERLEDSDIFDTSFAVRCLCAIGQGGAVLNESQSLPKLTRIVETDDAGTFGVVTTKICVGSFKDNSEQSIALKSRQAGIVSFSEVSAADQTAMRALSRHRRHTGRTDELVAARRQLNEILHQQSQAVTPVVESLYLTRKRSDEFRLESRRLTD